jgi:hypothetical protein
MPPWQFPFHSCEWAHHTAAIYLHMLILSVANNSAGPDTPGCTVSRIAGLRDGAIGISEGAFGNHPGQQTQHLMPDLLRQALPWTGRHR